MRPSIATHTWRSLGELSWNAGRVPLPSVTEVPFRTVTSQAPTLNQARYDRGFTNVDILRRGEQCQVSAPGELSQVMQNLGWHRVL
jgi:hypothetical protein